MGKLGDVIVYYTDSEGHGLEIFKQEFIDSPLSFIFPTPLNYPIEEAVLFINKRKKNALNGTYTIIKGKILTDNF